MDGKIKIKENGKEKEFDELFTFDLEDTGKSYVGYTDYSADENGDILIRLSEYDATGEDPKYYPVTDEEVIKVAQKIINSIQKSAEEAIAENKEN